MRVIVRKTAAIGESRLVRCSSRTTAYHDGLQIFDSLIFYLSWVNVYSPEYVLI